PRLRKVTERKQQYTILQLRFWVVWPQLYGFLEQLIGLWNLTLAEENDAHLPEGRRLVWVESKDLTIFFSSFAVLIGGEIFVCAREVLLLVIFLFGTPKTGGCQNGKRHNQREGTLGNYAEDGCLPDHEWTLVVG